MVLAKKTQVTERLFLTTMELIILFGTTFYTQNEGVAMGSPLAPSFDYLFISHPKNKLLNDLLNLLNR